MTEKLIDDHMGILLNTVGEKYSDVIKDKRKVLTKLIQVLPDEFIEKFSFTKEQQDMIIDSKVSWQYQLDLPKHDRGI